MIILLLAPQIAVLGIGAYLTGNNNTDVSAIPVAGPGGSVIDSEKDDSSNLVEDPQPTETATPLPTPSPSLTASEPPPSELRVIKGDFFQWKVRIEPASPRREQPMFFDVSVVNADGPEPALRDMVYGDGAGVNIVGECTDEEVRSQRGAHEYSGQMRVNPVWEHTYEKRARYIATITLTACGYSDEEAQAVEYEFSVR